MKAKIGWLSICMAGGIFFSLFQASADRKMAPGRVATETVQTVNTPEQIRSLISRMKEQMEKDAETLPELMKETEQQAETCTDPAGAAVLHSMLAELYNHYYQQNRWKIGQRTELAGYVPDDIREWTPSLFEQKIKEELERSLQPAALLQQTKAETFQAILKEGKDSRRLRPTLFDFLAYRALAIQPDAAWFEQLIAFRRTQPEREALLQVELDYGAFRFDRQLITVTGYENTLDSLSRVHDNATAILDINAARLEMLNRQQYQGDETHRDSVAAEIYHLCKTMLTRYSGNEHANPFQNRLNSMENPTISVQTANNVYPGKTLDLRLTYTNVPRLTVRIYQSLRQPEEAWRNLYKESAKKRGKLVKEQTFALALPNTYTEQDTLLCIPMSQLGLYEYELTTPDKRFSTTGRFSISRLAAVTRQDSKFPEVLVTDIESGKPIEGATVVYYTTDMKTGKLLPQGRLTTNRFGIALLPKQKERREYVVRPLFQNDTASIISTIYLSPLYKGNEGQVQLSLFTDRSIYRPGQTVSFKGIAYIKDTEQPHVVPEQSYTVSLRDANGKEVANKTFETNRFGSFNGEFTLPKESLNGLFRLHTDKGAVSFRVEAYKRPSFKLDIQPIKEEVSFGYPMELNGTAQSFSGVALQEGTVKWTITRRPFWLRSYMPDPFSFTTEQVASGTASLDSKGNFTIPFTPERPKTLAGRKAYQNYEVRATLTDSKGETQETSFLFSVGETGLLLTVETADEEMEKDAARITVRAKTINGQPTEAQGSYTLYALGSEITGKDLYGTDRYSIDKQIRVGTFQSDKPLPSELFRTLPSGRYRIEVKATDANGQEVATEKDFILYASDDPCPPVFRHQWLIEKRTECLPGEEAEFVFGTSDRDVYLLYEIFNEDGKRTKQELLRMNNENRTFRIPFRETDGNGFMVSFTFVRAGELHQQKVPVYLRRPDKKLTIRTETFRDKLLPGSKEQWKFRIVNADSAAVSAEVLASLYDASLDKLYTADWYFAPKPSIQLPVPYFYAGSAFQKRHDYAAGEFKSLKLPSYVYDQLDWQDVLGLFVRFGSSNRVFMTGAVQMKSASAPVPEAFMDSQNDMAVLSEPPVTVIAEEEVEVSGVYPTSHETPVPLRENFAETAFFYPVLTTDTAGNVAFSFTMPESNTTWKLRLLAHTEDLHYGMLTKEVVTSKPLMVTPNLPRFFRVGDEVSLTAQVSNLTGEPTTGEVCFELFDPETGASIDLQTDSHKTVSLLASDTKSTGIRFRVPAVPHGVVGCRIVAETDKGSDGEQHLIPVLSNEILVTESTPFYLFDKEETTIQLQNGKNGRPFRTTLELTANPVWYAVQALPTLAEPENDDAVSWFASYYSSTLAQYIANTHPRIRQIVSRWEASGGDENSLLSRLETDAELKNIARQETPWLLEAENETEQLRRLSLLFDLNRAAEQRATALRQLLDLQTAEGGWSWFKGMRPSPEITGYILRGMSQLIELNAVEYNQEEKEMQIRALQFLDKEIADGFQKEQEHTLSSGRIDYLFVRSAYRDIPEPPATREAIRCYTRLAAEQWKEQDLYQRGEIAWLMHRNGNKEVAAEILAWFRKTATVSDSKGMYWANNRRNSGFFLSPMDTHCLLMALFDEMASDKSAIDRMKHWLLSQKQTQHWGTTPTTVNAIYALLLTGSDWLSIDNCCTATWGDQTYNSHDGKLATGYLKVSRTGEQANKTAGDKIVIRKEGDAPAWGAVYEQYFQSIEKVKKHKGILNVERKLFVETNDGNAPTLRAVAENERLHVGDKLVVRLVIQNDREMDYVFLKDLRPGCVEPAGQLSGTKNRDGIWYYQSPTDVAEHFFFDHLPEGTFVLEYALYVSRSGTYAGGISTIQCLYAPEFVSHTEGVHLQVE